MTPLTDRYKNKIGNLEEIFSEKNYLNIVFDVEMLWLESITTEMLGIHASTFIRKYRPNFSYEVIKNIEKETKHDVASVFTYIQEFYSSLCDFENQGTKIAQLVHFGLTSQDLVSISYTIMCEMANTEVLREIDATKILENTTKLYKSHHRLVGFTHGQMATPISTDNLLDFLLNSNNGLSEIISALPINKVMSRFLNGACGDRYSLNKSLDDAVLSKALTNFKRKFANKFSVKFVAQFSRQSDSYPQILNSLDVIKWMFMWLERESKNLWLYASHGLISRERSHGEIGSSTMSQKVNPISFENCEGNCKFGVAMVDSMSKVLFDTRLDRDLSDLTVIRNLGLIYGHLVLAINSFSAGCGLYVVDGEAVENMLKQNYQCLAEAVNLILRRNLYPNSYLVSKNMFMGISSLDKNGFDEIIKTNIKQTQIKKELLKLEI